MEKIKIKFKYKQNLSYFLIRALFIIFIITFFSFFVPPSYINYVNDYANLINDTNEIKLNKLFQIVNNETSVEIAILTVNSLNDDTIENASNITFEKWGIGKKGKDNGILIFLALNERKVRIEVGYGLEGDITDIKAKNLLQNYGIPYFKENNFNDGLFVLSLALVKEISKIYNKNFESWLKAIDENENDYEEIFKKDKKDSFTSIISTIIFLIILLRFFPNIFPFLFLMNFGGRRSTFFGSSNFSSRSGRFNNFGGFGGGRSGGGGASSSF